MIDLLRHRTYRDLLAAQVTALIGTALATVAFGLLAYDLAGTNAGTVLGTALAIKMVAYVGVAPLAAALTQGLPRRALPKLLERWQDRTVMLAGLVVLVMLLLLGTVGLDYRGLLGLWFVAGLAYAIAQTPSGRLLRRSAHPADRPALFAAQFALSYACWLVFYPLAGWIGASWGMPVTFADLAFAAMAATALAVGVWPVHDPEVIAHAFCIDDQHKHWPHFEH